MGKLTQEMMNQTLEITILLIGIILVVLILDYKKSISNWRLLVLFLVVAFVDNFLYIITSKYPSIQIIPTNIWNNYLECNWSAKIYSVIFMLIILSLSRDLSSKDIGLRLKQEKGSY